MSSFRPRERDGARACQDAETNGRSAARKSPCDDFALSVAEHAVASNPTSEQLSRASRRARYVRLRQTGKDMVGWALPELSILAGG